MLNQIREILYNMAIKFADFVKTQPYQVEWYSLFLESLDSPVKYRVLSTLNNKSHFGSNQTTILGEFKIGKLLYNYQIKHLEGSDTEHEESLLSINFFRIVNGIADEKTIFDDLSKSEVLNLFSTLKVVFERAIKEFDPYMIYISPNHSKKFDVYKSIFNRYLSTYIFDKSSTYAIILYKENKRMSKDPGFSQTSYVNNIVKDKKFSDFFQ